MSNIKVSKFSLQIQRIGSWEKPTYALLSVRKCLHANLDILRRTESSISGKLLTFPRHTGAYLACYLRLQEETATAKALSIHLFSR